jgi:(S)-ureidoglycine aminohydrolase
VTVLDGAVSIKTSTFKAAISIHANQFAYFPAGQAHSLSSENGAGLLIYERVCALKSGAPQFQHGDIEDAPVLPVAGEVFVLRKLLPQTKDYDFNVHVMDFWPGEYLNVKEVHYNQHGLLLLAGKGIYRLGNDWYPVQAGDAIWMAPYVVQWYAALGTERSRYIIYKDTTVDPLVHT